MSPDPTMLMSSIALKLFSEKLMTLSVLLSKFGEHSPCGLRVLLFYQSHEILGHEVIGVFQNSLN